ncbi:MAG TPA: flavin prenyltransferase UbiX [Planctomycetaceae bacterium]|jgi:4-hydroxy-3-polyprenylbenzoate decarboxylase|nr:flavin prenyltransferase UbiX [Planctomycetaceae bacterium]
MMRDLVVAITGASGAIYAVRLLEVLLACGRTVHVTLSPAAAEVMEHELGLKIDLLKCDETSLIPKPEMLPDTSPLKHLRAHPAPVSHNSSVFSDSEIYVGKLIYHHYRDYYAGIASGSFLTEGMVICPCSGGTLSSIATGQSQNLIHRAADVHLKERRKLIVVPRETPLSGITLHNMKVLSDQGAVILPASPGFYHHPRDISDLVDFVVARICDQLGVRHDLTKRWGAPTQLSD